MNFKVILLTCFLASSVNASDLSQNNSITYSNNQNTITYFNGQNSITFVQPSDNDNIFKLDVKENIDLLAKKFKILSDIFTSNQDEIEAKNKTRIQLIQNDVNTLTSLDKVLSSIANIIVKHKDSNKIVQELSENLRKLNFDNLIKYKDLLLNPGIKIAGNNQKYKACKNIVENYMSLEDLHDSIEDVSSDMKKYLKKINYIWKDIDDAYELNVKNYIGGSILVFLASQQESVEAEPVIIKATVAFFDNFNSIKSAVTKLKHDLFTKLGSNIKDVMSAQSEKIQRKWDSALSRYNNAEKGCDEKYNNFLNNLEKILPFVKKDVVYKSQAIYIEYKNDYYDAIRSLTNKKDTIKNCLEIIFKNSDKYNLLNDLWNKFDSSKNNNEVIKYLNEILQLISKN